MRIHKEGFIIIPVSAVLIGLLYALLYYFIPIAAIQYILAAAALIFWILIVRFFRNPEVPASQLPDQVLAPAEGKVVVIEKTREEEYLKEERIQISIFMSPLNVHVNRSPFKGKISYFKYHPGKYLVAWHPKSSTDNERTSIGFELENGKKMLIRQIAGAVARRIRFYPQVGDPVDNGSEVGFIRFGSRVDVYLPLDADIKVKIGDITDCGKTVLATLK
ncbi:MAG: phosphatidylserine decarboxylase family protein [Cyclobacteriaceae bacterium]|nr:phosphatidylserine decarboxylase family protein [Cyclobacteriaceae bacterium SS2]